MPRFNLDDDEARALANYFAAAEKAEYPYQPSAATTTGYLADRDIEFTSGPITTT